MHNSTNNTYIVVLRKLSCVCFVIVSLLFGFLLFGAIKPILGGQRSDGRSKRKMKMFWTNCDCNFVWMILNEKKHSNIRKNDTRFFDFCCELSLEYKIAVFIQMHPFQLTQTYIASEDSWMFAFPMWVVRRFFCCGPSSHCYTQKQTKNK